MEISDSLLCLFSARVEERDDAYVVEIPEHEIEAGAIQPGEIYRIGMLSPADATRSTAGTRERASERDERGPEPPVDEGDVREVEIEDIGEQGDGIARIGPGYVVFVPGTAVGDRVMIEITDARENFAFGEVIESL